MSTQKPERTTPDTWTFTEPREAVPTPDACFEAMKALIRQRDASLRVPEIVMVPGLPIIIYGETHHIVSGEIPDFVQPPDVSLSDGVKLRMKPVLFCSKDAYDKLREVLRG